MGIELLERAAEAKGTFLKAEQLLEARGDPDPSRGPGYLLTFDVGRVLVVADRGNACLAIRQVEAVDEYTSLRMASLEEEEPWWRVAGNPLVRAWPAHSGEGAASASEGISELRMQFRQEGDRPRIVSMRYQDGAVLVAMPAHVEENSE
ncbi:MAG: hypothetical protein OSB70_14375 [Myxococcota bacterium]|nr:hypothetical protein [Myxococcota bacterium]